MLAEERALTSGALWTEPRIGDWRQPGTPLSIRTLLKRLYPAAKTDADLVLLGAFAIARCFGSAHQLSVAVVCREVKPVGKPDAGNPHVRFDERGRETERCRMAQATAPVLDSTCAPTARVTSGGRFHPESCRLIW